MNQISEFLSSGADRVFINSSFISTDKLTDIEYLEHMIRSSTSCYR